MFVCVKKEALKKLEKEVERAFSLPPLVSFFLSSLARVHVLSPSLVLTLSLPRSLSHSRSLSLALSRARSLSGRRLGRLSTLAPNAKGKYRSSTCSSSGLVVEHVYGEHILWRTHSKSQNTFYRGNSLRMP